MRLAFYLLKGEVSMTRNRDVKEVNPQELLWLHQTISPSFSVGGPDPKDPTGEKKLPGEKVAAVANKIKKGKISYTDFPPLNVFTITDPDDGNTSTFSISNRRLTAFKLAGANTVHVKPAKFKDVYHSLWRMTSESGGWQQPQQTNSGQKNVRPGNDTLLGKFRNDMERAAQIGEVYCDENNIHGEEREKKIKNGLKKHAKQKYNFN